jgi:hypothetical protein
MKAQSQVLPVKPAKTFSNQRRGQYATLAQQTPLRSPKRTVGNPPPDRSSFCEFLYGTPRRQLAVRPVLRPLPALRVRSRASKYIYIDAFRCQSVTRETLLRYTSKSTLVNNLISGNLWKMCVSDCLFRNRTFQLATPKFATNDMDLLPPFWQRVSSAE